MIDSNLPQMKFHQYLGELVSTALYLKKTESVSVQELLKYVVTLRNPWRDDKNEKEYGFHCWWVRWLKKIFEHFSSVNVPHYKSPSSKIKLFCRRVGHQRKKVRRNVFLSCSCNVRCSLVVFFFTLKGETVSFSYHTHKKAIFTNTINLPHN